MVSPPLRKHLPTIGAVAQIVGVGFPNPLGVVFWKEETSRDSEIAPTKNVQ